jgi:hypothetical protein
MSLHHKLKLSFNPQEYCDTNGERFSLNPSCSPEHNLLYYSVTSNFKEIGALRLIWNRHRQKNN